jgi:hypothetical protein
MQESSSSVLSILPSSLKRWTRRPKPQFRSPILAGGCKGQAFETQQTVFTIDNIIREPACAAPCYLVPSGEEIAHVLIDVLVNAAEC